MAGRRGIPSSKSAVFDPFELYSLTPFQNNSSEDDGSIYEASITRSTSTDSTHSCHDNGLVSSCDPAASEFLLFALALHDQGFDTHPSQQPQPQQQHAAPASKAAACSAGCACALTRHCAGVLDAMLPAEDCALTDRAPQHDTPKKQAKQKPQGHCQQQH
jgi:hypothetical protein